MGIIQQSLQTINPIHQHPHSLLYQPLHQNNTKQSKWPSSSLSSSPPWPLLPSPPPRVRERTPRLASSPSRAPPSAATVRRSHAATLAMLRATSSTSRPTASPSPFKRFRFEHGQRSSLLLVVIDRPLPHSSLLSGHVFYLVFASFFIESWLGGGLLGFVL